MMELSIRRLTMTFNVWQTKFSQLQLAKVLPAQWVFSHLSNMFPHPECDQSKILIILISQHNMVNIPPVVFELLCSQSDTQTGRRVKCLGVLVKYTEPQISPEGTALRLDICMNVYHFKQARWEAIRQSAPPVCECVWMGECDKHVKCFEESVDLRGPPKMQLHVN